MSPAREPWTWGLLVYDELINLDRDRTDPRLPWTQSRAFMAKLTHTFQVG